MKRLLPPACLSLILFIIDRITKYIFLKIPDEGVFLTRGIGFKLYSNPGIAFSIPLPNLFSTILVLIILIGLFYYLFYSLKKKIILSCLPLLLIIIGSISNLIDRIRFGGVVDFINIYFWPAFNLADCYIILGIILLIWRYKLYSNEASKTVTGDSEIRQDFSK